MKHNTYAVTTIIFVAAITTVGTVLASLPRIPTQIQVWVRKVEGTAPTSTTKNVNAGTHDLTLDLSGSDVIVNVVDTTTPPASGQDTRLGRLTQVTNDVVLKTAPAVVINSGVTVQ